MMTILSPEARRQRWQGRLFLTVLAAGLGFCGGAWASSDRLRDLSRTQIGGLARGAARDLADRLYDLADAPSTPTPVSVRLAGGPPAPALTIQVTEAWAAPGSSLPMPPERLFSERL